ncbi:MAG: hypothetical protein P4L50_16495, partial [Anaerolineaceae bacterium]|nr:hypothetical protein [Anaerolineaceae bacterium]
KTPKPQNPKTPQPKPHPVKTLGVSTYSNHLTVDMNASDPYDSVPDLCNLASFAANSQDMFKFKQELTPAEISALASLLASGAEIEYLYLFKELPAGAGTELGEAIQRFGSIRTLSLGYNLSASEPAPELLRLIAASATPALEQLDIYRLNLDDSTLCDSFGKFSALHKLSITDCDFNTPLLAERINEFPALESLRITYRESVPAGVMMLVAALENFPVVAELNLSHVGIDVESRRLIGELVALGEIRKLNLIDCKLGDEGISEIVTSILASGRNRCELWELCLPSNGIESAGAQMIAELVARSPHLRCLNLDFNPIGAIAAEAIKKFANTLEELNISKCGLGPREAVLLLSPPAYPALTTLRITNNYVGNLGAGALAQFLLGSGGCTLKELRMESNDITEAGALELANGFAKAYALRSIRMEVNQLGPRGAAAMLDAIAIVSTVQMDMIYFDQCEIGDDGAEAAGRLIMGRSCKRISLNQNEIHDKGVKAIADSIEASECMIELLSLYVNPVGDAGVKYFLDKVLYESKIASKIGIGLSCIGVEEAMAVRRMTEVHGTRKFLSYSDSIKDKKARDILNKAEHSSKSEGWTMVC